MGKGVSPLRAAMVLIWIVFIGPLMRFNDVLVTQTDRDKALQLVTLMHQRMASGDIDAIYNDASSDLKNKYTLEQHEANFSAMAEKYGSPMNCQQDRTQVRYLFFTRQIQTICATDYSNNEVLMETLTWSKSGDDYRLYGYRIGTPKW